MDETDAAVDGILTSYSTWAVIGCSPNADRDSYQVAAFLQGEGYRVIPVNPQADEALGERCYASLTDVPSDAGVEVVNIFRRSEDAGRHVDEAIAIGAKAVWMQRGIVDEAAAQRARDAGLEVVMDRSARTELKRRRRRLSGPLSWASRGLRGGLGVSFPRDEGGTGGGVVSDRPHG